MKWISDLLSEKGRDTWSLAPDATVYEAIELMAEKGIGALLVIDGEQLVGILSERDYARKVILKGKASRQTRVDEIMSHPVYSVRPEFTLQQAMTIMTDKHIRHLPVTVKDRVVGIISIGDVVKGILSDKQSEIEQLTDFIHKEPNL